MTPQTGSVYILFTLPSKKHKPPKIGRAPFMPQKESSRCIVVSQPTISQGWLVSLGRGLIDKSVLRITTSLPPFHGKLF